MVVDKMHFRNHVDKWCRSNCNPYDRVDLEGVNINVNYCVGSYIIYIELRDSCCIKAIVLD